MDLGKDGNDSPILRSETMRGESATEEPREETPPGSFVSERTYGESAGFHKKTVRDLGDISGKTVLEKVNFDVPLLDGQITDDLRIRAALPTIQYLLDKDAKLVLISHLGRPKGKVVPELSLAPVAVRLSELLGREVVFVPEIVGVRVQDAVANAVPNSVILLENLRFDPREEQNDAGFAAELAQDTGAEIFVQDGFAVAHRAHASIEAITHILPSVAGFLLEDEVANLTAAVENPRRPLLAVIGGAKIADKAPLLEKLVQIADKIAIGGAMANTFLKFKGFPVGASLVDEGADETIARTIQTAGDKLILPVDVVVADEINVDANVLEKRVDAVLPDDIILDIGPKTRELFANEIANAETVIWNGNLGYTEIDRFAAGSAAIAEAIGGATGKTSIIGGGDTAGFVLEYQKSHLGLNYTLISTGGGASLEVLSGMKLPGVEALQDR